MAKKVLKFGGTSVGTIERILHVAKIVKKEHDSGNEVIAIVSAMSGKTNELLKQSKAISENFNKRELDVLLSSGEQVTSALLAGALIKLGINSKSWLNWQIPILTEGEHSNSRIININIQKINKFLSKKGVAIIPGFQGISQNGEITTLGRGGSDASAVAIAKIFQTDSCICSKSRHTIDEYLQYDYVGAPWEKNSKDKHKYGGNGGFSFRKKSAMLSVINKFPYNKEHEDVYFSRKDIKYPPYKVAKTFAVEHVFYDAPFGIHKAYKYQSKNKLNNMLEYCPELQTIFDIKN